jgi:formate/nitrite transporter
MEKLFLTQDEIACSIKDICRKKVSLSFMKTYVLAILAGAYIGFGAHLYTIVTTGDLGKVYPGLNKFLGGSVFSVGLMLVIIAGSELFTGNSLLSAGVVGGEVKLKGLLRNWAIVYFGNFTGSVLLALMIARSGILTGAVGENAIRIAYYKTTALSFNEAILRGIGCNWLVCLAIILATSARTTAGKIWAIYFPIMAFVASGFEHSVANMYFIPAGIFTNSLIASNISSVGLTWSSMFLKNLIPVTIGNIIGGSIFVGFPYALIYGRNKKG